MTEIHPTAIVDPRAELSENVVVGPYCVVGAGVRLGAAVRLDSHVVVAGRTTIGSGCRIFPFACLGHRPQDLKYRGEDTELVIGRNNQIREHVTMHPGTAGGGGITRVGDEGLFMAGDPRRPRLPGRRWRDHGQQRHAWAATSRSRTTPIWVACARCISSCASAGRR